MQQIKKKKINSLFFIICSIVVLLVSVILGILHFLWWYYLIGVVLGILTHILMVVQTKRFIRIQKDRYEKAVFAPKKDAILWIVIRILTLAVGLLGAGFLAHAVNPDRMIEAFILLLCGYTTIKGAFIAMLYIFKEGR